MKLAFMGSDPIALPLLDYLQDSRPAGCCLDIVFTQPDRRTGRGMHLQANDIKQWALSAGLEVAQPLKCGRESAEQLQSRGIDLVLVMAYGKILPRSILEATPHPILNVHASTLPRLRGASPIHTAVALGLESTGVSLMQIIPQLDAGPVAGHEAVAILPDDSTQTVSRKLALATIPLVDRALPKLAKGDLVFKEQDASAVSYCRIIDKADAHLDFNAPARELYNRVRAFQPWPGTVFPVDGIDIRILEASLLDTTSEGWKPGTVRLQDDGLRIACGSGWLVPRRLQRPGGKALPAADFLRGFSIAEGAVLPSRPMRPLESDQPFPYKRK